MLDEGHELHPTRRGATLLTRQLIVTRDGGSKDLRVTIPDDARVTFGPFSPPSKDKAGYDRGDGSKRGTLRVYNGKSTTDVIAVISNVTGFSDTAVIEIEEKIAVEEGATMWKSDKSGYKREEKVTRKEYWDGTDVPLLADSEEEDS